MATAAELQAILDTLSPDQMMLVKSRLDGDRRVKLTIPALLSQTQLDELCVQLAEAYPPIATQLNAII